jgi:type IV pilus assembly protein PilA
MKRNESGFSLVELMIVVGIIGILASLALPKMQVFMAKAKQSEARTLLSHLYTLEQSYFVDNDTFSNSYTDLGYVLPSSTSKSNYKNAPTFTGVTATAFTASLKNSAQLCDGVAANANEGTIDQNRKIVLPALACN